MCACGGQSSMPVLSSISLHLNFCQGLPKSNTSFKICKYVSNYAINTFTHTKHCMTLKNTFIL